jgi:aspartyl-tRNA synthetase
MQNRIYIKDLNTKVGGEVTIAGWVNVRRDQGKMIFMDFRDMTGLVQGVILPGSAAMETGKEVRPEWVVEVRGKVNERPERNKKPGVLNGDIELEILGIEVLNKAETLPYPIDGDTREVNDI